MIKYLIPAIIVFLIVLFWEKITDFVEKKFNIKLNYIVVSSIVAVLLIKMKIQHLVLLDLMKKQRLNTFLLIQFLGKKE